MDDPTTRSSTDGCVPLVRVSTFRVPADDAGVQAELRALAGRPWGRCRWVGRRILYQTGSAEIVVVSIWDDAAAMQTVLQTAPQDLGRTLRAAVAEATTEIYDLRAHGAWGRDREPCLVRIFRGHVVEGDPAAFDEAAARRYVGLFETNPSCLSIAAGLGPERAVVLATLWTDWDAVVGATGGDLRQVLPLRLPPWAVDGSAVHYELIGAIYR